MRFICENERAAKVGWVSCQAYVTIKVKKLLRAVINVNPPFTFPWHTPLTNECNWVGNNFVYRLFVLKTPIISLSKKEKGKIYFEIYLYINIFSSLTILKT